MNPPDLVRLAALVKRTKLLHDHRGTRYMTCARCQADDDLRDAAPSMMPALLAHVVALEGERDRLVQERDWQYDENVAQIANLTALQTRLAAVEGERDSWQLAAEQYQAQAKVWEKRADDAGWNRPTPEPVERAAKALRLVMWRKHLNLMPPWDELLETEHELWREGAAAVLRAVQAPP